MHSQNLREYVDFLRRALPEEDRIALPDAALERVARHALTVREATPWGRSIPEWIFRDYVLFPRVNDEFPEAYHAPIWESLRARLAGLSMTEAALEVNVWCAEHATYQSTDNRTAGPLTVLRRGCGRCGEESTLLTAALRVAGIPARQMYSPRWAHCDDNHAWVEAWLDGGWHYMGACEPEPEPDSGWFTAAASKAMLVHTRAFGDAPEGERVERKYGNFSIVNRTAAYARTRRVTVRVADGGRPLPGAAVRFELANMAELYPISEKITDARGEAELETGHGTLRIHVTDGNRWLAQTTDAERVEIDLKDGIFCGEKAAAEAPRTQKSRAEEEARSGCSANTQEEETLREGVVWRGDGQNALASERCAARRRSEGRRVEAAQHDGEQNTPASRAASRECRESEALWEEAAGRGDGQNVPASERCAARRRSEGRRVEAAQHDGEQDAAASCTASLERRESEALREEAAGRGDGQNAPASQEHCESEALRGEAAGCGDGQNAPASEHCAARRRSEGWRAEAAQHDDEQDAPASRAASRECRIARGENEALRFVDEKLCADASSEVLHRNGAAARENGDAMESALPSTERFVQRPPRETRIQPTVHSEAVARRHAEMLRRCERLRAARCAELVFNDAVLARARGNAGEIRAFLADERFAQADKRALLSTLREKDLADTSAQTLIDALETALPAKAALPETIWREAVLCPRIADEKLLPVRRALRQALGEGLCLSDPAGEWSEKSAQSSAGAAYGEQTATTQSSGNSSIECTETAGLSRGAGKAAHCVRTAENDGNPAPTYSAVAVLRQSETTQSRVCAKDSEVSFSRVAAAENGENTASAESTVGTSALREGASEGAEAATSLPLGAGKAAHCVRTAENDGNPAPPHSAAAAFRQSEMVQNYACADDSEVPFLRAVAAEDGEDSAARAGSESAANLSEADSTCGQAGEAFCAAALPFAARAVELWRRIEARVRPVHSDFPLVPDLRAVLRAGRATAAVRDILFAAAARACGIPARLNPASGEKEVWDGAWRPLLPMERGRLRLTNRTGAPRVYGVDFTVGILENGVFRTLNFWGESLEDFWEREVPAGVYRVVHCARQIDGSVDGELRYARIAPSNCAEIVLEPLPDRTSEKLLRSRLPELRAEEILQEESGNIFAVMNDARPEEGCGESSSSTRAAQPADEVWVRREPSSPTRAEQPMYEGKPQYEANHSEAPSSMRAAQPTGAEGRLYGKDSCESTPTMRAALTFAERQPLPRPGRASLLAVLDPGAEPTEHFLNEILEIREEFKNIQLELLISRRSQCENAKLAETLCAVPHARLWTDFDSDALLEWRKALGAGDLRLPLAVAFDAQGEALFAFTNYNVGSVRSLLRCIAAAD